LTDFILRETDTQAAFGARILSVHGDFIVSVYRGGLNAGGCVFSGGGAVCRALLDAIAPSILACEPVCGRIINSSPGGGKTADHKSGGRVSDERAKHHWDPDAVAERIAAVLRERKGMAVQRRTQERRMQEQEFQERMVQRYSQAADLKIPPLGLDRRESVTPE
jgi:hypothetical protein